MSEKIGGNLYMEATAMALKVKRYPLYHCRKCGKFYRDQQGTTPEGLRGQQSEVINIICEACDAQDKSSSENP